MSVVDKYLVYRGDIKAIAGDHERIAFVTRHPEGASTPLYRLETEKFALSEDPLPGGGLAVISEPAPNAIPGVFDSAAAETLWIAGGDAKIYRASWSGGAPQPMQAALSEPAVALALLDGGRLAAAVGSSVAILSRTDGKISQTLDLSEPATCLASDPTGQWLAVGTEKGTVAVYTCEGQSAFRLSNSEVLHEGAVAALLFEPHDLRLLTSGADQKILSMLARGKLEPEDKGRGNAHAASASSMIWGPGDRLWTGSADASLKNWPRAGNVKPATLKDGVGKVAGLAIVSIMEKPHLAVACDDNTIRLFPIDAETGKCDDLTHRIHDIYDRARHELGQSSQDRREEILKQLAAFDDRASVELIASHVGSGDASTRAWAARLLTTCKNPRVPKLLEGLLAHHDETVRVAAFRGLRKHLGASNLDVIDLALKTGRNDLGKLAIEALAPLASEDDQALDRLLNSLNFHQLDVRRAALLALETVQGSGPEADLTALGSKHADLRKTALIRLMQRGLLGDSSARSAIRRRFEDGDADVRKTAFLLALLTREKLAAVLRARDSEIRRQIGELEGEGSSDKGKEKDKAEFKTKWQASDLMTDDLEPLVQATASLALDTCLRGARGLAVLGDARAFGLLLQLSREEDKAARAEVCRSLGTLGDPRGVKRLRSLLFDQAIEVRDAAFSSLAAIEENEGEPLSAADSGLSAGFEDIRRRALGILAAEIKKKSPKKAGDRGWDLLIRALNDSASSVRSEAFKTALNLGIGGGGGATLRFAMGSVHADVRREALNEAMAQTNQPWSQEIVLEFYNDPDAKLREEAFQFANKKTKGLEFLDAGLSSRYADVRKLAIDGLIKKHTRESQKLLIKALDDDVKSNRLDALQALIDADARPSLLNAIEAEHDDVRVRAAKALANHGAAESLAPLRKIATRPAPEQSERVKDWVALTATALDGLGRLGDPAALPDVIPHLDSKHEEIRTAAARSLPWLSRLDSLAALRSALQHSDEKVKSLAALGLAYFGDASVSSLLFSDQRRGTISEIGALTSAFCLGSAGEDQLVVMLDSQDAAVRKQAMLLLMFQELKDPTGTPSRILACLSSFMPRVRLSAADALEVYSDHAAFRELVVRQVNDQGESTPPWKISAETIDDLAELTTHADPLLRARTVQLLPNLTKSEQKPFDQAWSAHAARYKEQIRELRDQAAKRPVPKPNHTPEELRELAFGAYVGLVREQGGSGAASAPVTTVRRTALSRILSLVKAHPEYGPAADSVFIQALGDPNQIVRQLAFNQLLERGMDRERLGGEALETGHSDLGIEGLELLSGGSAGSGAAAKSSTPTPAARGEGQAILERVMLTRKDDLAIEAAKLLIERGNQTAVATQALEAAHREMRTQAIAWLESKYADDDAAKQALRQALKSRYRHVREGAAVALALKKDATAFDALTSMLKDAGDARQQDRVINALTELGDPRAASAFLDRIENDPAGTAAPDKLIEATGKFRRPEDADRLFALAEKDKKQRQAALNAIKVISGYDQEIEDDEDENPDRTWEAKQHPRRDAILARLIDRAFHWGEAAYLRGLIPGAQWSRGSDVDPALAVASNHPDERTRRDLIEAIGWRLRKRGGPADVLLKNLKHKDNVVQLLAAEGLAKGRRNEGLSVLQAAIDYMTDGQWRERAVLALGELADERALDLLLRLAGDDAHALQEPAIEAIGHMGKSSRSHEVFKILERMIKRDNFSIRDRSISGLRWLNTLDGWNLIRQVAADESLDGWERDDAIAALGYNDAPATRELLLKILAGNDGEAMETAWTSARRLWGEQSLEPAYAFLQSEIMGDEDEDEGSESYQDALKQVALKGETRRIIDIFAKCPSATQSKLMFALSRREPTPWSEAKGGLTNPEADSARLAAYLVGRAGSEANTPEVREGIEAGLVKWRSSWFERLDKLTRDGRSIGKKDQAIGDCLKEFVYAAGRLGIGRDELLATLQSRRDDDRFQSIRKQALMALSEGDWTPAIANTVAAMATKDANPDLRALAADLASKRGGDLAARLADDLTSDSSAFRRVARRSSDRIGEPIRLAAGQAHQQGVVAPILVKAGEVEAFRVTALDRKAAEAVRLGAIESLGRLSRTASEDILKSIGQDQTEDEDLRKAAWRAVKRSSRARKRAEAAKSQSRPQTPSTSSASSLS